ncbi:MAG: heavy metal translocating P-type ATPase, partial [Ruminococcus sp.]
MKHFEVTGMSCAACTARVEKAVMKVEGVTSCSVSLLTNSMGVEGTADSSAIISAVRDAGYDASPKGSAKETTAQPNEDSSLRGLKKRLIASLVFLLVLMYVSMGHMMWNFPLPSFIEGNHIAMGIVQLILSGIVMVINQRFFISGFKGLWKRSPNMDTLVALGAAASFIYSTYALFAMTDAQLAGKTEAVMDYMHEFYFESAAMILTLITLGKLLEARSKGKTTSALAGLISLAPKTAAVIRDNAETVVPIEQVLKGDVFVVRPGENIPVDGIVLEGSTTADESTLTGESIPAEKNEGSMVSAGTLNLSGFIRCEAQRVGEDTTLSQIIRLVSDAQATKAPVARVADKVAGVFVPFVIVIAVITAAVWLILGQTAGYALARGISVLVISCPCALGLATPVAIMAGSGMGAKNGILFKTAVSLENTGKAQIAVLDKTGTITEGKPEVTDIIPFGEMTERELLTIAYSLEVKSSHPFAGAVNEKAQREGITAADTENFTAHHGSGLSAELAGEKIFGGNYRFISETLSVPKNAKAHSERLAEEGKTPLFFAKGKKLCGIIACADKIKHGSIDAVKELQNMGLYVVMLTGDNKRTACAIGKKVGADEVIAEVLPADKEKTVRLMQEKGSVIMVGDGINDAPALTSADIGIAIGAGADAAIDAADVVLMKSSLADVPAAIRLSRSVLRNIHENLFWAFIYNIVGIPLAAGVFIGIFGWELSPSFAAAAMSLSSFSVVTN